MIFIVKNIKDNCVTFNGLKFGASENCHVVMFRKLATDLKF